MTAIHDQWRLDVLSHGARLVVLATSKTDDLNEAHLLVHRVMARAMNEMVEGVTGDELDAALARSFRRGRSGLKLVAERA